ncbi:hypothetical protein [Pedobacter agri]|uniref:hypothetical protein n=1 Tax=Pedobacter agri TaxID=454586 RepID=UPI0029314BF4|nr:hypothetical protein [Pedobacter agri]
MAAICFIPFIFYLLYQKANTARTNEEVQDYRKFKKNMLILSFVFVIGSALLAYLQLVLFK